MPWPTRHPEDEAIDRARDELAAIRASQPDAVNAAQDALAKATVKLHAAEMQLRICRRLGKKDVADMIEVELAQAAVMVAGDLLIEALDVAAGRSERAA